MSTNNPILNSLRASKKEEGSKTAPEEKKTSAPVLPSFSAPATKQETKPEPTKEQVVEKSNPLPFGSGLPQAKSANPFSKDISARTEAKATPLAPTHAGSKYQVVLSDEQSKDPALSAIAKKKVEDMSQEELRQVYLNIKPSFGNRLYSASEINDIEKYGDSRPEYKETDSLFIGDQVHKAMELGGTNLSKLKCYEDLGGEPEIPELGLTKGEMEMLDIIAKGKPARNAVWAIRNNKVTRDVPEGLLVACEKEEIDVKKPDENIPGEIVALEKLAIKETANITKKMIGEYQKYLKSKEFFDGRKQKFEDSGDLIVDKLSYRKMGARRMIQNIKNSYEALRNSKNIMQVYNEGFTGKGKVYTEQVVLWTHTTAEGKEVNCKSMLDRLIIDEESKVATVSDIKTHGKTPHTFISENYYKFCYYRSMSFYKSSVEFMLKQLGHNPEEFDIRVVLLPVSTAYGSIGCHFDVAELSPIDIESGKEGGYFKPFGSKYDRYGRVETFMSFPMYKIMEEMGLVHEKSRDLYRKGWVQIIEENEAKYKSLI